MRNNLCFHVSPCPKHNRKVCKLLISFRVAGFGITFIWCLWFSLLLFLIHILAEHQLQATIHLQWQELWNYFCQYLSFLKVSCILFIILPFLLDLSRSLSCCCLFGLLFCLQVRGAAASCFASFARRNPPQELTKVIQIKCAKHVKRMLAETHERRKTAAHQLSLAQAHAQNCTNTNVRCFVFGGMQRHADEMA